MNLVIVLSHPIQYFAPVFALLTAQLKGDVTVVYCSRKGLDESYDEGYGERFKWSCDLLRGYKSTFLAEAANNSDRPTEAIRCSSLPKVLHELSPSGLLVSGYSGPVARTALGWAKANKVRILMRGDTWSGPGEGTGWVGGRIKRMWFRRAMAPWITGFLAVGSRNREYWQEMGAKVDQIIDVPYGVNKSSFKPFDTIEETKAVRARFGLNPDLPVLGFVGRFIEKKGIAQLLAYLGSRPNGNKSSCQLLIAGNGALRPAIDEAIELIGWPTVKLGFVNQDSLPDFYRACDALLVPSLGGETWGFVVQECLACGIPVIVSDSVGCVPDLVREGLNGSILPSGAWEAWSTFLDTWLQGNCRINAGEVQARIQYVPGYEDSARAMALAVTHYCSERNACE
jgi:glycosyltransferase involved in cell wall biosynthesis